MDKEVALCLMFITSASLLPLGSQGTWARKSAYVLLMGTWIYSAARFWMMMMT